MDHETTDCTYEYTYEYTYESDEIPKFDKITVVIRKCKKRGYNDFYNINR